MKKLILSLLCVAMAAISANAEVFYVKLGGTGKGTSWNDAFGGLNDAAVAAKEGDQIWVGPGEFIVKRTLGPDKEGNLVPTTNGLILQPTVSVYGGFAGTETDISQRAKVAGGKSWDFVNVTEIKGETNAMRLIQMPNKGATAAIPYEERPRFEPGLFDGLTITHVNNSGNRIMWSREGSAYWKNCRFIGMKDNSGCLYFEDAKGGVEDCYFENCKNPIQIQTAKVTFGYGATTTIKNCEFKASEVRSIFIFNITGDSSLETPSAEISNCTFYDHLTRGEFGANPGGGCIMLNQGDAQRAVIIAGCTFKNNIYDGYGAATIGKFGGGSFIVYNNLFENNSNGYIPDEGEKTYGSIFHDHTGSDGAIGCAFFNNVFVKNSAQRIIYSAGNSIFNNTVVNNTGLNYFQGAPFAWNNIFANNMNAGADAAVALDETGTYLANANTVNVKESENVLDNVLIADPSFANASAGNYRLVAGSPCIGIGSNIPFEGELVKEGLIKFMKNGIVDMDGNAYSITAATLNAGAYQGTVASGLNSTEKNVHFEAYAAVGGIVVKVQDAALMSVYNFNGQLVATRQMNGGEAFVPLAKGLYLVKVADKVTTATVKVAVK